MVAPVTGAIGVRATLLACGIILTAADLAPLLSKDVRKLTLLPDGPHPIEESPGDPSPDDLAQDLAPPPAGQPKQAAFPRIR